MPYGGVGLMLKLARDVGLMAKLDRELDVLQRPRPYTDADHVMSIVLNVLCGGHVLEDIELRRNDLIFLDALGARSIPDPTTAGDTPWPPSPRRWRAAPPCRACPRSSA